MRKKSAYIIPLVGGIVSILAFAGNAWLAYSPDLGAINDQKQRAKTLNEQLADEADEAARQIAKIEAHGKINESREAAGLYPFHTRLRIIDYEYDPHIKPRTDLSGYTPDDFVRVFDKNRVCIGFIYRQHFSFKGDRPDACEFTP